MWRNVYASACYRNKRGRERESLGKNNDSREETVPLQCAKRVLGHVSRGSPDVTDRSTLSAVRQVDHYAPGQTVLTISPRTLCFDHRSRVPLKSRKTASPTQAARRAVDPRNSMALHLLYRLR
ncbi:hypothetical protein MTO96_006620 [Rhipicephalus appendiculatus]